jgi:hypothetical protein
LGSSKTLINAGENTDVELPLQIFSNNTSIPITENDSIITVNIDEDIVSDNNRAIAFLSDLKNENDPIVIEYDPEKFQKLYYGNSALLNKLKYYVSLLLIIVLFSLGLLFYRSTK